MIRKLIATMAIVLAFTTVATSAEAKHRKHRAHYSVGVSVPAERVAEFRRLYVDRNIGPSGDYIDRKRYYYRPYHYWRGPLVYRQVERPHRLFAHSAPKPFSCWDTKHGVVCRER